MRRHSRLWSATAILLLVATGGSALTPRQEPPTSAEPESALADDKYASNTSALTAAEGVRFFTRNKVVTSRWLDPSHGGINLGFPRNE